MYSSNSQYVIKARFNLTPKIYETFIKEHVPNSCMNAH